MTAEPNAAQPTNLRLLTWADDRDAPGRIAVDRGAAERPTGAKRSIRVLIAAGPTLVRASYRALLERDEWIDVVGEAASGHHAVTLARETAPDVALLDLALPGLDDLGTMAAIVSHAAFARVAVMLIAARDSDERVLGAVRAGAVGVLSNDAEPAELIRAAQVLACGDSLLPSALVHRLVGEVPSPSGQHRDCGEQFEQLTDREREVVALVATGLTNSEIGERLVISPATAKTHVSRAMVKLGARDRAQLVVLAYESGLVLPRSDAARSDAARSHAARSGAGRSGGRVGAIA